MPVDRITNPPTINKKGGEFIAETIAVDPNRPNHAQEQDAIEIDQEFFQREGKDGYICE